MRDWIRGLDGLLRGRRRTPEALPLGPNLGALVGFGGLFGAAMGLFAAISRSPGSPWQVLSSALKVPAVFLGSLLVTLPSLVVFSALLDLPLRPRAVFRTTTAAGAMAAVLLASLAPIVAFFTFCTTSYPFMKLLDGAFAAIAATVSVSFLLRGLGGRGASPDAGGADESDPHPEEPARPGRLLRVWIVLLLAVAAQMAWVLRPLVGAPDKAFAWFEPRGGNFVADLAATLRALLGS